MLYYLIPKIRTVDVRPMICVAIVGGIIGGAYGIVHDQITYAISPEYFTKLKFHHFHYVAISDVQSAETLNRGSVVCETSGCDRIIRTCDDAAIQCA